MSQRSERMQGESFPQPGFFADAMLGSLARWLRVLGCDTCYRRRAIPGEMERAAVHGRVALTRNKNTAARIKGSVFIESDHVGSQLKQLAYTYPIASRPGDWFTLCLDCNTRLRNAAPDQTRDMIPDFVFHASSGPFKLCPSCGRFFWPGSHRRRMIEQLHRWGLSGH